MRAVAPSVVAVLGAFGIIFYSLNKAEELIKLNKPGSAEAVLSLITTEKHSYHAGKGMLLAGKDVLGEPNGPVRWSWRIW